MIASKVGLNYEAASAFATSDDFLDAAEDMEADLRRADPAWAAPLLAEFSERLDVATREHQERNDARKDEQKAILQRDQSYGALRPVFVRFRRCVRATFGSSSREYRELLDRSGRGGDDDDPTDGGSSGGSSPTS